MDSALRVKSQERKRRGTGKSGNGDEDGKVRTGGLGQAPSSVTASGAGLGVAQVDVDPFGLQNAPAQEASGEIDEMGDCQMDDVDENTMNEGERRSQQDFNYNARNAMSLKKSIIGNGETNASKLIESGSMMQPARSGLVNPKPIPKSSAISYQDRRVTLTNNWLQE